MDDSGNRVSSSKRTMMEDDDRSVPSSSVHAVVYNDDLLIEILLRLPVISLLFFKSVSKRWLSLITSPVFFNLHLTRFPNIHSMSGLFLQQTNSDHDLFEHDFVSLNSRIPRVLKKKSSAFPFGGFGSDTCKVRVLHSCNGLVLCVIRRHSADRIYVYNPSINVFKMLPPVHDLSLDGFWDKHRLAFDPTKSPHYKVLHVRVIAPARIPGRVQQLFFLQTHIYSSETGCWRIGSNFSRGWICGDFLSGVYWNDAIHWLDIDKQVSHFNLDSGRPYLTAKTPETFDSHSYRGLFESRGCLLLAYSGDPRPEHLEIYEMRNDYSGWSAIRC